jgi:hypothetical protein
LLLLFATLSIEVEGEHAAATVIPKMPYKARRMPCRPVAPRQRVARFGLCVDAR